MKDKYYIKVINLIEEVKKEVYELLNKDNSGHGMNHINRVLELSLNLQKKKMQIKT